MAACHCWRAQRHQANAHQPMAQPPADSSQGADTSPAEGEARSLESPGRRDAPLVGTPSTRESRVAWLLAKMDPDGDSVPEVRPLHLNRLLREQFGISATTATADIAEANARIQQAIDALAPHVGGRVKSALERIAQKAEKSNTVEGLSVASATWQRLGKICGLEEKSEAAKASALTDDQLRAAIAAHTEQRAVEMSEEDFAALVEKRRAAKENG